jgi:hypothetical protein
MNILQICILLTIRKVPEVQKSVTSHALFII